MYIYKSAFASIFQLDSINDWMKFNYANKEKPVAVFIAAKWR